MNTDMAARIIVFAALFWIAVAVIVLGYLRYKARLKELWHERELRQLERDEKALEVAEREYEEDYE